MENLTRKNLCRLSILGCFVLSGMGFFAQIVGGSFWFMHFSSFYAAAIALVFAVLCMFFLPEKLVFLSEGFGNMLEKHYLLFVVISALLLFSALVFVNRVILLQFMNSADENSCFFFAQYLLDGKLWAEPHALSDFFYTPHIGVKAGKWFSVYPPGWPVVWMVAIAANMKDWINPLLTSLAFLLWTAVGKEAYGKKISFIAVSFLLISPFFLMTGAAYYSHNLCLFLLGVLFFSTQKWIKRGGFKWAIFAGIALGYGLATRYLTMAAMSFPVCVFLLWSLFKKSTKISFKAFFLFLFLVFIITAIHLCYNFLITGSFFDAPNHFLHSHEKLGFIAGYSPLLAAKYLLRRIFYLSDWIPPFLTILFFVGIFSRKQNSWDILLRVSALMLPFAYIFYYSWGGNQYGPRYLFEAYPIFCFIASFALINLWKNSKTEIKKWVFGIFFMSILFSFPLLHRHFSYFKKVTFERKQIYTDISNQAQKPALVFLKGFIGDLLVMSENDAIRNTPSLNSDTIYAHDFSEKNVGLLPYFKSYKKYRVSYDRKLNKTDLKELFL